VASKVKITGRMPKLPGIPRAPKGFGLPERGVFARGVRGLEEFKIQEPAGEIPPEIAARYPGITKPEWAVLWALLKLGYREGYDVVVHALIPGLGLGQAGQVDFYFPDLSLAFEVQGLFWHYSLGRSRQTRDLVREMALAEKGILVVHIDADMALENPIWVVEDGLRGVDHSRLQHGF
jgi:hypothetical protein